MRIRGRRRSGRIEWKMYDREHVVERSSMVSTPLRRAGSSNTSRDLGADKIFRLQSLAGNRAVTQLLSSIVQRCGPKNPGCDCVNDNTSEIKDNAAKSSRDETPFKASIISEDAVPAMRPVQLSSLRDGDTFEPAEWANDRDRLQTESASTDSLIHEAFTSTDQSFEKATRGGTSLSGPTNRFESETKAIADQSVTPRSGMLQLPQELRPRASVPNQAVQRQVNNRGKNSPLPSAADVLRPPQFRVETLRSGAVLTYGNNRRIILSVTSEARQLMTGVLAGRPPYAYEFVPVPTEYLFKSGGLAPRHYPIIRIVAAPGVEVRKVGWPDTVPFPNSQNPWVEIYRVQDPVQLPLPDTRIDPFRYSLGQDTSAGAQNLLQRLLHNVEPRTRADGVDFWYSETGEVFSVTAPERSPTARFAYQVVPPDPVHRGRLGHWTIRLVKTPSVKIKRSAIKGFTGRDWVLHEVYEVPSITQVPTQGAPITSVGRQLTDIPTQWISGESSLAVAIFETGISAIPIVGTLYDLAATAYGATTGRDFWGQPLSTLDVAIMGAGALLPFVGRAARLAARLRRAMPGMKGSEQLIRAAAVLSEVDRGRIERWQSLLRSGQKVSAAERQAMVDLFRHLDEGVAKAAARDTSLRATANLTSEQLAKQPQALRREFQIAQSSSLRRTLKDEVYEQEVILGNGHVWRRQRGTGRWCRFSADPLCFIFGEGTSGHIETFPAVRKAQKGAWSGTPGKSEFTPDDPTALIRADFQPIVYRGGFPDFTPFEVTKVLVKRSQLAIRSRRRHNLLGDRALALQREWLLPNGKPDMARAKAFRTNPADPLIWHHIEGDNILQLVPEPIHKAAQHAGGYSIPEMPP